jgi:hypothetical protein
VTFSFAIRYFILDSRVITVLEHAIYATNKDFENKPAACTCMLFAIALEALGPSEALEISLITSFMRNT